SGRILSMPPTRSTTRPKIVAAAFVESCCEVSARTSETNGWRVRLSVNRHGPTRLISPARRGSRRISRRRMRGSSASAITLIALVVAGAGSLASRLRERAGVGISAQGVSNAGDRIVAADEFEDFEDAGA